MSADAWLSILEFAGAELVLLVLVAMAAELVLTGLGVEDPRQVLLLLLAAPLWLTPLPLAASNLAARALVWCSTDLI